jgi:signal transduction histidine kinase
LLEALANTTAVALENVRIYAELEQRVQERTRQLEAANRELETFSFSVSHDLRSPLHSIGAYAEFLEETAPPPTDAERREYLMHIRQQTVRMGRMIEDFLRLAQLTRADLKPEPVDLVQIATELVPQLEASSAGRQVEFIHPPALPALGDPRLLQAALQNLLSNAWKYTGRRKGGARVELGRLVAESGPAVFFVRDNGAGFDPRYLDKLFTPFQRLHSAGEFPGSGVGLATVQRIIHKHGGRIWAEGKPEEGATFYFTLVPEPAA